MVHYEWISDHGWIMDQIWSVDILRTSSWNCLVTILVINALTSSFQIRAILISHKCIFALPNYQFPNRFPSRDILVTEITIFNLNVDSSQRAQINARHTFWRELKSLLWHWNIRLISPKPFLATQFFTVWIFAILCLFSHELIFQSFRECLSFVQPGIRFNAIWYETIHLIMWVSNSTDDTALW